MMDKIVFENEDKAKLFEEMKKTQPVAEIILEDGTVELFFFSLPSTPITSI